MRKFQWVWLALAAASLSGVACNKTPMGDQPAAEKKAADPVAVAIAELPESEQEAARKQRICPVGGGLLGSMGKPFKVKIGDQDVYLCCQGCEEDLRKNPEEFLAKLKQ